MEEILASIRRIISEDAPAAGDGEQAAAAPPAEDVLELTEIVPDEPAPAPKRALTPQEEIDALMAADDPEPPPAPPATPRPVPAAAPPPEDSWDEPVIAAPPPRYAAPEPDFASVHVSPRDDGFGMDGEILSNSAAVASTAALAGLTGVVRSRMNGGMHVGSDLTLEELMRELLRPLLKEWLDANLPSVVERLVQREVERIARRAEGR